MIEKVIYQKNYDSHENSDRVISTVVNGDIPGFKVDQVRACKVKKSGILGNHWREYSEVYGVIGKARITLEDVDSKARQEYKMETGSRLFVPARIALKIEAEPGTIVITCSPKAEREKQSHKYEIK